MIIQHCPDIWSFSAQRRLRPRCREPLAEHTAPLHPSRQRQPLFAIGVRRDSSLHFHFYFLLRARAKRPILIKRGKEGFFDDDSDIGGFGIAHAHSPSSSDAGKSFVIPKEFAYMPTQLFHFRKTDCIS